MLLLCKKYGAILTCPEREFAWLQALLTLQALARQNLRRLYKFGDVIMTLSIGTFSSNLPQFMMAKYYVWPLAKKCFLLLRYQLWSAMLYAGKAKPSRGETSFNGELGTTGGDGP